MSNFMVFRNHCFTCGQDDIPDTFTVNAITIELCTLRETAFVQLSSQADLGTSEALWIDSIWTIEIKHILGEIHSRSFD